MQVVHSMWTTAKKDGPGLVLWIEDGSLRRQTQLFEPISDFVIGSGEISRNQESSSIQQHPFALDGTNLNRALGLARISQPNRGRSFQLTTVDMMLPTVSNQPLASPWVDEDLSETNPDRIGFEKWRIPAIWLAPPQAMTWLLNPDLFVSRSALHWSQSVYFWREAANLVLYSLIHGIYEPNLREVDHQIMTSWSLKESILANQLDHLQHKLPTLCQAEWFEDGTRRSKEAIVKGFFDTIIDFIIRNIVGPQILTGFPHSRSGRRRKKQNPLDLLTLPFLKAIYSRQNRFSAARDVQAAFVALVSNWLAPNGNSVATHWRTSFTLLPPIIDGASIEELDPKLRLWRVAFSLQSTKEPDHHIYAQDIWENTVPNQIGTGETLSEILLRDLGRALKSFDILRRALDCPHPTHVDLTTEEAHQFLSERTPHLIQEGFNVVTPEWWSKSVKPLKAKLKIDGSAFEGGGMMGFHTVVNFQWKASVGTKTLSDEAFQKLVKNKFPLIPIDGQWIEIKSEDLTSTIDYFQDHEAQGKMRLMDAMQMGLEANELKTAMDEAKFDYKGCLAQLFSEDFDSVIDVPQPKKFNGKLRPYQLRGLSWLMFHHHLGFGACLADDMGLGKTIQLLALLLYERENAVRKFKGKPTLMVCPMSVVGNWRREAFRFAPSLKVMIHHGINRLSTEEFRSVYHKYDLIITTYHLINRDKETLGSVRWHRIALDEAQNIKNPQAQQSKAAFSLKADHRVVLTGTPVENKLSELWSILEFLNPGYLGSLRDFQNRFGTPIEKQKNEERARLLRQLTQPFILRRLKTDKRIIKDLPEKIEMKVYCDLTEEQAAMYQAYVSQKLDEIENALGSKRNQLVLTTLVKLKQICNHPVHFLKDEGEINGRSGKLMRLTEMLEEAMSQGDKSLVFTQFMQMGTILRDYLADRFENEVLFIHGGVSRLNRESTVETFQSKNGPKIFVLTVKTGGIGLNLTAANHVFHFDRWWNPAVENQATDRAFRIGQRRNVQVHKMIAIGTLEDRIDMMIEKKKELAENIIGTDDRWLTQLSTQALRDILNLSLHQSDDL